MTQKDIVDYFAKFKRVQKVSISEDIAKPGVVVIEIQSWFPLFIRDFIELAHSIKIVGSTVAINNKWFIWKWLVWSRILEF